MRLTVTQLWTRMEMLNKTESGAPLELEVRSEDQKNLHGYLAFSRSGIHWKRAKTQNYVTFAWKEVLAFLETK